MILLFGPPGAGKSIQGHLLAARFGWRWLSAGQLLRDTRDPEIHASMRKGDLVPDELIRNVMSDAIKSSGDIHHVILDGFPRQLQQAQWLAETRQDLGRELNLVIVLDVGPEVILDRLRIRGRVDDTVETIEHRMGRYNEEMQPILDLFANHQVPIVHIDGESTVGHIHDEIVEQLTEKGIIE